MPTNVKMAFLYLSRYSALEALQRFSTSLARFAAAKGKPGLYNETITWGIPAADPRAYG